MSTVQSPQDQEFLFPSLSQPRTRGAGEITLQTASGDSVIVNKQNFLYFFGDTILGDAIRTQPDVEVIEITQPDITQQILYEMMVVTNNSSFGIPYSPNLAGGFRYLGGTLIPVISNLKYKANRFHRFLPKPESTVDASINQLSSRIFPENVPSNYDILIAYAVESHWPELATYLGSLVPPSETEATDQEWMSHVDFSHPESTQLARYFLGRDINPSKDFITNVLTNEDLGLVKLLLQNPTVDPAKIAQYQDINTSLHYISTEIFELLYADPHFYSAFNPTAFLKDAMSFNETADLVRIILQDPRSNVTNLLRDAIRAESNDIVRVLLDDPRVR